MTLSRQQHSTDHLNDLVRQIKSPHGVIPFVGAGLGVKCGFPTWRGLLEELLEELRRGSGRTRMKSNRGSKRVESIRKMLDRLDYEAAMDALEKELRRPFSTRIRARLGKAASEARKLKGPLLLLPELAKGPVITSNVDGLLERCFREAERPFSDVFLGAQRASKWADALDRNERYLFKIHGDAESQEELVLTRSEYDLRYGTPLFEKSRPLPAALLEAFDRRPILFLGCSLGPDRIRAVLRAAYKAGSGDKRGRHFAIVESPRDGDLIRERELLDVGVKPIWYPTGQHRRVGELLRQVLKRSRPPAASVSAGFGAQPPDQLLELCNSVAARTNMDLGPKPEQQRLRLAAAIKILASATDGAVLTKALHALDDKDPRFTRFFPIVEASRLSIGLNALTKSPSLPILHLEILRNRPRTPREGSVDYTFLSGVEILVYHLYHLDDQRPELEAHSRAASPLGIPVPTAYVQAAMRPAKAFLENAAPALEKLILEPTTRISDLIHGMEGILGEPHRDRAHQIVFQHEAFRRRPETAIHDLNDKEKGDLILKWLEVVYLVEHEALAPVIDLSGFQPWKRENVPDSGPWRVEEILRLFIDAVENVRGGRPYETLLFSEHPFQATGRWLRSLPNSKPKYALKLTPAPPPDAMGYPLTDGGFCFDIDRTLLSPKRSLDEQDFGGVLRRLGALLKMHVRVTLITGNYSAAQKERVLDPLQALIERDTDPAEAARCLSNLHLFASTGSVRIHFDDGRFKKDESYDVNEVMKDERVGPQDLPKLLAPDELPARVRRWLRDGDTPPPACDVLTRTFPDMGSPLSEDAARLHIEFRDGVSATIKGTLFEGSDGSNRRDEVLQKLVAFQGQNDLYAKFKFTKAGRTSIDITFRNLTKASAVLYLLRSGRAGNGPQNLLYFGDEFEQTGNDSYLRDIRLVGATLVHIGDKPLDQQVFKTYLVRPLPGLADKGLIEIGDSQRTVLLDGPEARQLTRYGKANPERSYTIAELYYGQPLFAVSFFPALHGEEQFLESHIQSDRMKARPVQAKASLPGSTTEDRGGEQIFLSQLRQWLGPEYVYEGDPLHDYTPHGYMIRSIIKGHQAIALLRQGAIPPQKLGYQAHVHLRGGKVAFAYRDFLARLNKLDWFPSDEGTIASPDTSPVSPRAARQNQVSQPVLKPAFSSDLLDILKLRTGRGPTVYSFFPVTPDSFPLSFEMFGELMDRIGGERGQQDAGHPADEVQKALESLTGSLTSRRRQAQRSIEA